MKKIRLLSFSIVTIGLISCNMFNKSNQTPVAVVEEKTIIEEKVMVEKQPDSQKEIYKLTVSFFSKGEGIDRVYHPAFVKFLESYSPKVSWETTYWGREGETDYCFKLDELSLIDQQTFISRVKDKLSDSSLVHIDENSECVHKR